MHSEHNLLKIAGLLLGFALGLFSLAANAEDNLENGIGLHGYDPVSYFLNGPEEGNERLSTQHEGVTWHFASESNRDAFIASPQSYLPEYGGWCAYAMLEGDKVDIDPESYKIVNGKLYVFYDGFWGNTLKRWNKMTQDTPEQELITTADQHWQQLLGEAP